MNPYFVEDVEQIKNSGISLEGSVKELTSIQEEVHDQVYDQFCNLIDKPFERRRVYPTNHKESERSFPDNPIILMRTLIVEESPIEPDYLAFLAMNLGEEPTRRDFFHLTLSHGYAHQLWDQFFGDSIEKICRASSEGNPIQLYRAAGEAFAYWLSEQLNGFNFISEDLANTYIDVLDVRALKFLYTQFKQEGNRTSPKSVIQHLPTLIQRYISDIGDIELSPNPLIAYLEQSKPP